MYAIIATGGKQYKVMENDVVAIERLADEVGQSVKFDKILMVGEGAETKVGAPFVESATVDAEVVDHFRGEKVVAFKMKRRKGYRRKRGHRQELTKVKISAINS